MAGNLEALLPAMGRGGIPAMLDLPADVDDETMVELAIALSLQDQGEGGVLQQGLQGLQQLANLGQGLAGILGGRAEQEDDSEEGEEEERQEGERQAVGGVWRATAPCPAGARPTSRSQGRLRTGLEWRRAGGRGWARAGRGRWRSTAPRTSGWLA